MNRFCRMAGVGLMALACCGCLNVEVPADVRVGSSEPPRVNQSKRPRTYDDAVVAWEKACQRNAWLENENARLERKYREAKRDKEKYKRKYKDLKDRYDD